MKKGGNDELLAAINDGIADKAAYDAAYEKWFGDEPGRLTPSGHSPGLTRSPPMALSPRKRARLFRYVQYAVLVAVVVGSASWRTGTRSSVRSSTGRSSRSSSLRS